MAEKIPLKLVDVGSGIGELREFEAGDTLPNALIPALATLSAELSARSRRNLLINGNYAINQRVYVSGTATTGANQYTLDRWRVVVSGQSLTFAAAGNGQQITAPTGGVEQVVEGLNVAGGVYTLSWQGTASATVNGTAVTSGGQITLTANANSTVRFSSGTVSKCQLELGATATPFEFRHYGDELSLCQRYYEKSYPITITPGVSHGSSDPRAVGTLKINNSSNRNMGSQGFKAEKRVSPTIRYWDQAGNLSAFTVGTVGGGVQTNNFTGDAFRSIAADEHGVYAHLDAASVVNPFTAFCYWEASAEL